MQGLSSSSRSGRCNADTVDHEHAPERCNGIIAGLWAQILVNSGCSTALQSLTLVDN